VVAGRILQGGSERADGKSRIEAIVGGREIYVLAHSPAVTSSTLVAVTGSGRGNDVVLRGRIPSVRHASDAHVFLVPILVDNRGLEIFQVPRSSPGLNLQPYRLIDGAQAADLTFQEVILGADTKLPLATDPQVVLEDCLQWGMLASIAEALGIMRALNTATFSYLMTRKQFGAAIGTFQALRHRVADMHIAAEETLAIADAAIESFSAGPGPERTALISAAKVVADRAARRIGAEAVQLHGAMGVSDELDVSHYARRLIAIRYSLGSTDSHRSRFANTR
jgi:alkylation response protein AidB-like acyl-CoA dehydrogenase